MQAHALPLAGAERPALVPDRVRDPEPARGRARARRGAACARSPSARPSRAPGVGGEVGDRAGVPEHVRRLEVDEVRDREQRGVEPLPREHDGERRLGVDHRVPGADRVEAGEDHLAVGARAASASAGSNCLPRALARQRPSPPRRRRRGGRPRRTRPAARSAPRAAPPRPSARPATRARPTARTRAPSASSTSSGSPSCSPSARAIAAWCSIIPSTSRWPESANSSADAEAVQRRVARSRAAACSPPPSAGCASSWSYLTDFSAMSSPNHFACSCASVWQPTLISSAV